MGVWKRIDETFLTKRGIAVPADYAESICALGFRGTAEYTVKRFGLSDTPEDLMREWSEMADEEYAKRIFLFPGAKDYLLKLKNAGVNIYEALDNNDAYHALKSAGGLIVTGPTGTNVNDVSILLINRKEEE